MSGMTLMPSLTGSEFKSAEMEDEHSPTESRRVVDSGDSVHSMRSSNASPVPSGQNKQGVSRPPGLGNISLPSPVGKLGHSYTSSASTAQNMTLTPTSSIDGGDIYARQSSPFHGDGPSMSSDYSRRGGDESELPPGITNLGSFDAEDGEHDGLLGLQALRERAHSLPGVLGPYSSSPPVRGQFGGTIEDGRATIRPRGISRENGRSQSASSRPPLASATGLGLSTDHKAYQSGYPSSGSRSRDHSPNPPGVISRPGNSQLEGPPDRLYEFSRARSSGSDGGHHAGYTDRNQSSTDQLTQKFGQLSTQPQTNVQQGHHNFQRQQRASSLPGPMRAQADQYHEEVGHTASRRGSDYGVGMNSRSHMTQEGEYYPHHSPQYGHDPHAPPHMHIQRRSSLQNMPGAGGAFYGQHHNVHRRESLDFVPGHNRYPDGAPVVATSEEMRMYAGSDGGSYRQERMVSPGQSPMHGRYGGHHNRHPSDMGNSTVSNSSASLGSGMGNVHGYGGYGGQPRGHHHAVSSDDDLAHPLIGEHIDVHGDDRGYQPQDAVSHGRQKRPGGVDHSLPHYGGAASAHVMPSGSPQLPMPKIVYNVKFKRTQRTFVLGPRLNRDLKIGTYVKVEADRGEDLGIVVGKLPSDKYMSSRSNYRSGTGEMGVMPPPSGFSPSGTGDLKRIIRLATHDEVSLLQMKREEEDELLKICRTKVRQRALPMNVVDAEYQFDRHKLTFFFEAEGRVDFRELVRDLFSMYKTRIWMQQLDKASTTTCPTASEEPQAIVMDYGTPIIAPESEYSDFAGGAPAEKK